MKALLAQVNKVVCIPEEYKFFEIKAARALLQEPPSLPYQDSPLCVHPIFTL